MKRLSIILVTLALAAAGFCAMSQSLKNECQHLAIAQANWTAETQQLAQVQAELEKETAKVRDLREEFARISATTVTDPVLLDLLLPTHPHWVPPEDQRRLLAELGATENATRDYALVCKASLYGYNIHPFKKIPNVYQTKPELSGVLALTPEESQSVEAAFAAWQQELAHWGQANLQRTGPTNEVLVSYILPCSTEFEVIARKDLRANLDNVIGGQRTSLLENYCHMNQMFEKASLGTFSNKLTIWRVPGETGLYYTDGPMSPGGADPGIRNATAIFLKYFPPTFRVAFPGGWQEIAQREGFDLILKK